MSAMKRGIAILRWNETWGAVDVAVDFLERLLGAVVYNAQLEEDSSFNGSQLGLTIRVASFKYSSGKCVIHHLCMNVRVFPELQTRCNICKQDSLESAQRCCPKTKSTFLSSQGWIRKRIKQLEPSGTCSECKGVSGNGDRCAMKGIVREKTRDRTGSGL